MSIAEPILEKELSKIMESVSVISNATRTSDVNVIVDHMPSRVLILMGGRAKAIELTNASIDGMAAQNIKILEYSATPPKEILRTSLNEIVLVPTVMLIETSGVQVRSTGFLIATRALDEEKWKFIDASGIKKRAGIEAIFPNYPKDKPVPHTYSEVVE